MNKDLLKGHLWGYQDTEFAIVNGNQITMHGARYSISGTVMPHLLDFVGKQMALEPDFYLHPLATVQRSLAPGRLSPALFDKLTAIVGAEQLFCTDEERLLHSHGQLSVSEIYELMYTQKAFKSVDCVVYPQNEQQVSDLIRAASEFDFAIIPYGGGTNVSGALMLPQNEDRVVISLDLRRMDKILELDKDNKLAWVQAGITGLSLELALNQQGFTLGHEPDSIEFSTLGGWIATNSSGMKRAKYGNIENIVLEFEVLTPQGKIYTQRVPPRHASGVSLKNLFFGSEGNFGVITAAHLKLTKLPENKQFGSLLFKDFASGAAFLQNLTETMFMPASIRLVNNSEFKFGQALKKEKNWLHQRLDKLKVAFLKHGLKFKLDELVAAVYVFEGSKEQNEYNNKQLLALAKQYQAISGGEENGKKGYELTYAIAYLRDFFQKYSLMGETFETSAKWSDCLSICQKVEARVAELAPQCGISGKPYLGYRITQSYATGACIYFTFAFCTKGLQEPVAVFHQIESELRQVILKHGGSISHHHGVGKIRKKYLPSTYDETSIELINAIKQDLDPQNIFCAENGAVSGAVVKK